MLARSVSHSIGGSYVFCFGFFFLLVACLLKKKVVYVIIELLKFYSVAV